MVLEITWKSVYYQVRTEQIELVEFVCGMEYRSTGQWSLGWTGWIKVGIQWTLLAIMYGRLLAMTMYKAVAVDVGGCKGCTEVQ